MKIIPCLTKTSLKSSVFYFTKSNFLKLSKTTIKSFRNFKLKSLHQLLTWDSEQKIPIPRIASVAIYMYACKWIYK